LRILPAALCQPVGALRYSSVALQAAEKDRNKAIKDGAKECPDIARIVVCAGVPLSPIVLIRNAGAVLLNPSAQRDFRPRVGAL
jgi:hypothetical protein